MGEWPASSPRSLESQDGKHGTGIRHADALGLERIYSSNVVAKIWQVARRGLKEQAPLRQYPEYVPQTGESIGRYSFREADFWTCGFFPGSMYTIYERFIKYPNKAPVPKEYRSQLLASWRDAGEHWTEALHRMSGRTDTHDMAFIIQPALRTDWELTGNPRSFESVKTAAYALASRWNDTVGAIRSWDDAINHRYRIVNRDENFLVIIDSMCNLDLLYYIGHHTQDQKLIDIATKHAETVQQYIVRKNFSTYHLLNFDPKTGDVKARMTNQGHQDESTWSRGQAWAIMGFAQTYHWTKNPSFLGTAISCAELFLSRLDSSQHPYPFVPAWDFDAPQSDPQNPLRDVSAGMIAANGMLLIHQAQQLLGTDGPAPDRFLRLALRIVQETLDLSLDTDFASFAPKRADSDDIELHESAFDAILRNSTANNNEHGFKRYWDHGLVYADYYLLEFGNKLLRMGLV